MSSLTIEQLFLIQRLRETGLTPESVIRVSGRNDSFHLTPRLGPGNGGRRPSDGAASAPHDSTATCTAATSAAQEQDLCWLPRAWRIKHVMVFDRINFSTFDSESLSKPEATKIYLTLVATNFTNNCRPSIPLPVSAPSPELPRWPGLTCVDLQSKAIFQHITQ